MLAVSSAGKPLLEPRVVQFSRLVALSTWGELVRAPLMVQFPPFGGGFAPLGASPRRVAALMAQFPRLLAVRLPFGAVRLRFAVGRRPHRRPPRRKTLTTGGCGRGVLRLGGSDTWPRVSLAREPLNMRVNPLIRTPTSRYARGRRCPSARREAQAASAPQRTAR